MFPFGHGLSYSLFEYSDLVAKQISNDGIFDVSFKIKNLGEYDGREIAQVYLSDQKSSLPRPHKELKAFTKVTLTPGETKEVTLSLDREALGFYDDHNRNWIAEAGKFTVYVAASSSDIRLKAEIELNQSFTWTGL